MFIEGPSDSLQYHPRSFVDTDHVHMVQAINNAHTFDLYLAVGGTHLTWHYKTEKERDDAFEKIKAAKLKEAKS